jgi:hypothetical protein
VALLGLILALPALMIALSPRGPSPRAAAPAVLAVETVLIAGLIVAARERTRLRPHRTTSASSLTPARPARHVQAIPRAQVGRL